MIKCNRNEIEMRSRVSTVYVVDKVETKKFKPECLFNFFLFNDRIIRTINIVKPKEKNLVCTINCVVTTKSHIHLNAIN